jgi:hypothetical protein
MAITLISSPNTGVDQSASYPFLITVKGSQYGAANVTQHRFLAIVKEGTTELVRKYTVVTDEANQYGTFDFSGVIKSILPLSQKDSSGNDISRLGYAMGVLEDPQIKQVNIFLYEIYYLSGTYTSNALTGLSYTCLRGYAVPTVDGYPWTIANWYQYNSLENFISFSGKIWQVYPTRLRDDSWTSPITHPYLTVRLSKNGGTTTDTMSYNRLTQDLGVAYFPLFYSGVSDASDFTHWQIEIGTGATSGALTTIEEDFNIYKTVDDCEGLGETLMFQNRFNTWSFLHFTKKKRVTIETNSIMGELIPTADKPGRFKYNLKGAEVFELNTDWMIEEQNLLLEDLIMSDSVWIVDPSDGSLEQVVVVPNSIRLQTRWTDNNIQYTIRVKKSVDKFKP